MDLAPSLARVVTRLVTAISSCSARVRRRRRRRDLKGRDGHWHGQTGLFSLLPLPLLPLFLLFLLFLFLLSVLLQLLHVRLKLLEVSRQLPLPGLQLVLRQINGHFDKLPQLARAPMAAATHHARARPAGRVEEGTGFFVLEAHEAAVVDD